MSLITFNRKPIKVKISNDSMNKDTEQIGNLLSNNCRQLYVARDGKVKQKKKRNIW